MINIFKKMLKNLEIGGSINYHLYNKQWQSQLNLNSSKFTPELMMIIGSLLVVYGLYLYLNQEKKATNC